MGRTSATPPQACALMYYQAMRMWNWLKKLYVALNLREDVMENVDRLRMWKSLNTLSEPKGRLAQRSVRLPRKT